VRVLYARYARRPRKYILNRYHLRGLHIIKKQVAKYTLNLLITLSLVLPLTVQATPRADELLCEEVAEVVLEAVDLGYITMATAEHVIDGCYTNYLPNYQ